MAFTLHDPSADLLTIAFNAVALKDVVCFEDALKVLIACEYKETQTNVNLALMGSRGLGKSRIAGKLLGFNPNDINLSPEETISFMKPSMYGTQGLRNVHRITQVNGLGSVVWMDAGWPKVKKLEGHISQVRREYSNYFSDAPLTGVGIIEHAEDTFWEYPFEYAVKIVMPNFSALNSRVYELTFETQKEKTERMQQFLRQTSHLRAA